MKIQNEYIKITQGSRIITLNNYIYDEYLSLFSTTQYNVDDDRIIQLNQEQQNKELAEIYIKIDDPIDDIRNADIDDFDIFTTIKSENFVEYKNGVSIFYNYSFDLAHDIATNLPIDKEDYYNRKITALGFGRNQNIFACLDVNNYEIYIIEDENLTITRKDNILSEAICYGYDFPVHLSPIGDSKDAIYNPISEQLETKYAQIYSVGFAKTLGIIDEEFIIGDDINIKIIDDTKFSFNLKKGDEVSLYPQNNLYTGNDVYPLPLYVQHEFYPQNDLYTSNDLYPSDSNYKYICYKFRLYTIHWTGTSPTEGYFEIQYLDEYYTMFLENTTKGLFEIITKIERNDE